MQIISLKRNILSNKATIGTLYNESKLELCKTLELPWLDNIQGISCIPFGEYRCVKDETGKHRYWKILNVPNRTAIEFHPANWTSELLGCITLGQDWQFMRNPKTSQRELSVDYSVKTFEKLKNILDDEFLLKIVS